MLIVPEPIWVGLERGEFTHRYLASAKSFIRPSPKPWVKPAPKFKPP
jgi:hypothetical protein